MGAATKGTDLPTATAWIKKLEPREAWLTIVGIVGNIREWELGDKRPAVPVDEKDRPHLRQRVDDVLHALVKVQLVPADVVIGHAAHDLVDFGDGALDRLKDLKRMLVKDIERALDPVIGDGMLMAVVQPGRKCEQHDRQHHRRNHHQLQQSNG